MVELIVLVVAASFAAGFVVGGLVEVHRWRKLLLKQIEFTDFWQAEFNKVLEAKFGKSSS